MHSVKKYDAYQNEKFCYQSFERDSSRYKIQKQAANGKKMNSSLIGFSNKLADICCILPVAWPCINAATTEHIICCVKKI